MSALIKVSNHLALILPGESCSNHNASQILTPPTLAHMDTPEQVPCPFLLSFLSFNRLVCQIARNRELAEVAFPNGTAPKYGPAMLLPAFCGKWIVSAGVTRF